MKNITLAQYLLEQQRSNSAVTADLRLLLENVAHSCKTIANAVGNGALGGVLGSLDTENVQGEVQKKLDVISNEIMLDTNQWGGCLAAMASEEMQSVYQIPDQYPRGRMLLLFDPLDGSSNIDANISIGTIFSVLALPDASNATDVSETGFLQAGRHQIAAGYAIYGPQTMLVLSTGKGVAGFTLERASGSWVLTHPNMRIPENTAEFAINMSNMRHWEAPVQKYINDCLQGEHGPLAKNYNMRWVASMVADVHRIMSRGGIFMYPRDTRESARKGKLRLMYEANPMSFLVEQAGGMATDGLNRILDIQPDSLHQRVGVALGSAREVRRVQEYHAANHG